MLGPKSNRMFEGWLAASTRDLLLIAHVPHRGNCGSLLELLECQHSRCDTQVIGAEEADHSEQSSCHLYLPIKIRCYDKKFRCDGAR